MCINTLASKNYVLANDLVIRAKMKYERFKENKNVLYNIFYGSSHNQPDCNKRNLIKNVLHGLTSFTKNSKFLIRTDCSETK